MVIMTMMMIFTELVTNDIKPFYDSHENNSMMTMIDNVSLAYELFSEHVAETKLRGVLLSRPSNPDHDGDDDDDNNEDHNDDDDNYDDDDAYLVILLLMLQPSEGWLMISDWLSTGRSTFDDYYGDDDGDDYVVVDDDDVEDAEHGDDGVAHDLRLAVH